MYCFLFYMPAGVIFQEQYYYYIRYKMGKKIDLRGTIDRVLEEEFEIEAERLKPDAALFTDLELDSLDIVDLIVALEQAFSIKIRAEAAQTFRDIRTLDDLYTAIESMYNTIQAQK